MSAKLSAKKGKEPISTPAFVTMQWLSYAFWALASIAIVYLVSVITNYVLNVDTTVTTEAVAYAVAASFIVLPLAFTLDVFFSRHEDDNKSNASSVVMVVHAVGFAVISVIALITAVFNLINMVLNDYDDKGLWIAVVAAVTTCVLFGILFIRTIKPELFPRLREYYRYLILALILIAGFWAIFGPGAKALDTKQSRGVRDSMMQITSAVDNYVTSNGTLPKDIDAMMSAGYYFGDVSTSQMKDYIVRGVLSYEPNTKAFTEADGVKTFYYKICGTFDRDLMMGGGMTNMMAREDGYYNSLDLGNVTAGTHCYDMATGSFLK